MTTIFRSLSASRSWRRMLPPIKAGISSRLIMNALVRTAAVYSRAAMTKSLRMIVPHGVTARDADEDVLERRPGHLEVTHGTAFDEAGEDLLRVGRAVETEFLHVAVVCHLDHPRQALGSGASLD